jgi:hypothetical protein
VAIGLGGCFGCGSYVADVDVLVVARIGIRRAPRGGAPTPAAHPHPAVPDDPGDVRRVRLVPERAPHLMPEGGPYRLAPVAGVLAVREAAASEGHADRVVAPRDGWRGVGRVPGVRVRVGLVRTFFWMRFTSRSTSWRQSKFVGWSEMYDRVLPPSSPGGGGAPSCAAIAISGSSTLPSSSMTRRRSFRWRPLSRPRRR